MSQVKPKDLTTVFTKYGEGQHSHAVAIVKDDGTVEILKNKLGAVVCCVKNEPNGSTVCKKAIEKIVAAKGEEYANALPVKTDSNSGEVDTSQL